MQQQTRHQREERIRVVIDYIGDNLDQALEPEELARIAGFSLWHFHRVFKEAMGQSLGEYIRDQRLKKAASRLKSGDESVVKIALDSGYETHSGFTRAFTTRYSQPPARYRQSSKIHEPRNSSAIGMREDRISHRHNGDAPTMLLRPVTYAVSNYRLNGF